MHNQLSDAFIDLLEFQLETIANLAKIQSVGQRKFAKHIDMAQRAMNFIRLFGLLKERHKNMKIGIIAKTYNGKILDWVEYLREEMEA